MAMLAGVCPDQRAHTYQTPASQAHVYHAGKAFGDFQRLLDDFSSDTLHETIVDFHNTPVRYQLSLPRWRPIYTSRRWGMLPRSTSSASGQMR